MSKIWIFYIPQMAKMCRRVVDLCIALRFSRMTPRDLEHVEEGQAAQVRDFVGCRCL